MVESVHKRFCEEVVVNCIWFKPRKKAAILVRVQSPEIQGIMRDLKMTEGQAG